MNRFVALLLIMAGCVSAVNVTGTCVTDGISNITYCGDNSTIIIQNITNTTVQQCNATSVTLYANSTNHTATVNNVSITCLGSTQVPYCNATSKVLHAGESYAFGNGTEIWCLNNATSCTASRNITPSTSEQTFTDCGVTTHIWAISTSYCYENRYETSSIGAVWRSDKSNNTFICQCGSTGSCSTLQANYDSCISNYNSCTSSLGTAKTDKTEAEKERDNAKVQFATLGSIINSTKDELKACRNASLSTVGLNCKNAILPVCTDSISAICKDDEISKNDIPACIQRIRGENNESLMSCEIDSKSCSDTLTAYKQGDQNNSNLENIIAMVAGTLIILLGGGALVAVYLKRKAMQDEIR